MTSGWIGTLLGMQPMSRNQTRKPLRFEAQAVALVLALALGTAGCLPPAFGQGDAMSVQPSTGEIRLIVVGDDIGSSHGANVGTIEAYQKGIMRSANLIVPGSWLMDAVKRIAENPGLDVGIHLAITSEWEGMKWRPLTWAPSMVDQNGYFFPMTQPREGFPPKSSVAEAAINPKEAEREIRAQIETAKRLVPRVAWLSTHMGGANATPELRAIVERLSKEYKLPLPRNVMPDVQRVQHGYKSTDSAEAKTEAIVKALMGLTPGTWVMVDHPALDTPEMRAIGHVGYEHVAADRDGVVKAWTSPRVLDVVKKRGIQLTSWGEVLAQR